MFGFAGATGFHRVIVAHVRWKPRENMLHHFAGWLTAKSWSCESCIHEFTGSPSWPGPSDVVENSSSNGWKSETELPRTPSFPMVSLMLHWVKCGQRMPKRLGHDRVPWPRAWPAKWWLYRMQLLKHYYSGNLGVTQLKSVAVFLLESVTNALQ